MNKAQGHYAVIFTSQRTATGHDEYEVIANRMVELAKNQNGFLGVDSARDTAGLGITVSYWKTLEDINIWRKHDEHLTAQMKGRSDFYESFSVRICKIEREYEF